MVQVYKYKIKKLCLFIDDMIIYTEKPKSTDLSFNSIDILWDSWYKYKKLNNQKIYFKRETICNGIKYQVPRYKSNRVGKEFYEKSYKTLLKNIKKEQN